MTPPDDASVANALMDIARVAKSMRVPWALIGGMALRVYGVPRETLDADALVPLESLGELADSLVTTFGWTPLVYDESLDDYVEAPEVVFHRMDDPVLFDIHQERVMVPLRTPFGLPVELLAAQHPVEEEMVDYALIYKHHSVNIPVAPLGGILLVKTKADRAKDIAAIEQTAEHLPAAVVKEAVAWAEKRDPASTEDLRATLSAARARRVPTKTTAYKRK